MTLSLDTAYRSFGGEVEASSTPTICRLPDSRRHQLSAIALTPLLPANASSVRHQRQFPRLKGNIERTDTERSNSPECCAVDRRTGEGSHFDESTSCDFSLVL